MTIATPRVRPRTATESASSDTTRLIARHRAETEQAIARIRWDTSLSDSERGQQITELLAEANRRTLALASRGR